ncbi:hypothetical protein LCGC14_1118540 [marine sediment metagenome]|uniref:Uncharacterized protein n=1 Tax=marine sediment metagenome TaxID=412755 RepID=A0A0F9PMU7_9ZZZZ
MMLEIKTENYNKIVIEADSIREFVYILDKIEDVKKKSFGLKVNK